LKKIFEDYGIEIFADGDKRHIRYDDGGIVAHFNVIEVSEEDALLAQQSDEDAYNVIIKYQNIEMGLL
jgi:hypothetical protein